MENLNQKFDKKQENSKNVVITVCMGSSCFARGNAFFLKELKGLVKENGLDVSVALKGELCRNNCSAGPNISIEGKEFSGLTIPRLVKILSDEYGIRVIENEQA